MSLRDAVVLALVGVLAAAAPAARAEGRWTLAAAVDRAVRESPDVRAAEEEVRAAKGRLSGASAPLASNPELSGGAGTRSAGGRASLEYEVALSQRMELGGQRGARLAAARAAVGAAEARLAATRSRVAAEVRELAGRAAAARLRAELAAEAERVYAEGARAAEKRFAAGDAARLDVTSARLELGRARRAALEAEQDRRAALAELELALALEPDTVREVAFELDVEVAPVDAPVDALVRQALDGRPDVAAARRDVDAAATEARLERRAAWPSPALGVSVAREEEANVVLGTLSLELPVFARNQGPRAAADARLTQARVALASLERRVAQEVRLAAGRVEAARRVLAAFDPETMAAVGEDLARVTRAYEAGQLEFVRYQLLRREALEARRDRVDALEALNRAAAQLERAAGRAH